ncbi:MAG: YjjW family glycine radical enzyme activase [Clostridium argentinense]|uniref:YjjW family glycine radical enzyme activase n=1 Tax=Clostridium faecium TaxID=2762223 RepID=A0ABR8YNU9_9CLOT|nr:MULTISPECIES: YjjW family glycine radical enzyme activase [Clostridium]MBD8045928.1 YjjW family glycine radical enzyme activase [Clostridium faecium]MBS5822567.1 YjjW family glycine radical enzyme activase [Clostridium argentinense]MDU1348006.1 YjjW family glycine radical enzyme activase [Clostridium argentinense]
MSKTALVNKIIPFSTVDGEGNRTAIFLQGCNFNCLYCHNPETINTCINCGKCVNYCEYGALSMVDGKVNYNREKCVNCDSCIAACNHNSSPKVSIMTVQDIMKVLNKTKYFISGITVSGGECTLQSDFLIELFREVKKLGLTTFLDTNGSLPIYDNLELLEVTDKTMIDLKAFDSEENKYLTGMKNETVIENINKLAKMDKIYEIRTVVVPEVLNNQRTVEMGSKLISELNPNIIYKLIKYRPLGVREDLIKSYTPSNEYMEKLKNIAMKNNVKNVVVV